MMCFCWRQLVYVGLFVCIADVPAAMQKIMFKGDVLAFWLF